MTTLPTYSKVCAEMGWTDADDRSGDADVKGSLESIELIEKELDELGFSYSTRAPGHHPGGNCYWLTVATSD